jgi:hypothetical protein
MSRSKQTSKGRGRRRVVTALGVAGALSLAGGASASISSAGDKPTQNTAPVILAEEEISDVSLLTFYVIDKENAGARSIRLAAGRGRCGHGGCGGRGCGGRGCGGCRGCGGGGCGGCGDKFWQSGPPQDNSIPPKHPCQTISGVITSRMK